MGPGAASFKGQQMHIRNLGELQGEVVVFGGPYSNQQALQALVDVATDRGIPPARMICTGDIAAYCADPGATLSLIADLGCPTIKGNCEEQLASGALECGCGFEAGSTCSVLSNSWFSHCSANVTPDQRIWMADLPDRIVFSLAGRRHVVIHGGADRTNAFVWSTTAPEEFRRQIHVLEDQVGAVDVVLAGHSGIAFCRQVDGVTWVNAGAIGLPENDGCRQTRYVVLSPQPDIRRLSYDAEAARAAMERAGLVQGYHQALTDGHWPSEDVLPNALRRTTT